VVLENVERLMAERKLGRCRPRVESMREVTGAIIAIELVLMSVYSGGVPRRAGGQAVSAICPSQWSPRWRFPPGRADADAGDVRVLLSAAAQGNRLFRRSTWGFAWLTERYLGGVRLRSVIASWRCCSSRPPRYRCAPPQARAGWFVPPEDQGYLIGSVTLPDGATLQRTREVRRRGGKR